MCISPNDLLLNPHKAKVNVVEYGTLNTSHDGAPKLTANSDYLEHPSTEGAQAAQAAQKRLQEEERRKTQGEKHQSHSKPKSKAGKKVEKAEEAGLTLLQVGVALSEITWSDEWL